jgi:hypothetical protein
MKYLFSMAAVLLSMATSVVFAAPVTYVFDTVTSVSIDRARPEIRGTEKDTGAPLQVSWPDTSLGESRQQAICMPLFVTMLEKPGRYLLYLTIDEPNFNFALWGCRLQLRS